MDFQKEYQAVFSKVTASQETRRQILNLAKAPRKRHIGRVITKVFLAAVLISLLTVTASAASSEGGWLRRFFSSGRETPLTQNQMAYIEENLQENTAAAEEPSGRFQVRVKSALTDGKTAYVTVGITAPKEEEDQPLQFRFTEMLLLPDVQEGLVIAPDGSSPDALQNYQIVEDGDGRQNTYNVVFKINPPLEDPEVNPFDGQIQWVMRLTGVTENWYSDTGDPILLSENTWELPLNLRSVEVRETELLPSPKTMMASLLLQDDYHIKVSVTSFRMSSLTFTLDFTPTDCQPGPYEVLDIGDIAIVMKDGSSKTLLRVTAHQGSFDVPIVPEDVDYVLLSDGTKLSMPGQGESRRGLPN